jgi:hypothetical protein
MITLTFTLIARDKLIFYLIFVCKVFLSAYTLVALYIQVKTSYALAFLAFNHYFPAIKFCRMRISV